MVSITILSEMALVSRRGIDGFWPRPAVLCSPSETALQRSRKAEQLRMIALHFLRGFGMKREKRREAPPLFSRIQRNMREAISAAGFRCWWAGDEGEKRGASHPVSDFSILICLSLTSYGLCCFDQGLPNKNRMNLFQKGRFEKNDFQNSKNSSEGT